jgi:hypothetical protein
MITGRRLRNGSARLIVLAPMLVAIGAASLSAHRRDELLQAARIGIAADRIDFELSLTPGIAVADDVVGTIDRDRDGVVSADEQRDHAALVMAATELRIDGSVVTLVASSAKYPAPGELGDGDRSIEFRWTGTFPALPAGQHEIAFTNSYRSDIGVYLANALKPDSERVVIRSQRRDAGQQRLAIDFTIDDGRFATVPVWLFGFGLAAWLAVRLLQPRRVLRF